MGRLATAVPHGGQRLLFAVVVFAAVAAGQNLVPEWRQVGNSLVEYGLPSPATGPIERVWFAAEGSRLLVRTAAGRVFETADFETWKPSTALPPQAADYARAASLPEPQARVRANGSQASARLYAVGRAVYRSTNEGRDWQNVTELKGQSILGDGFTDLAVSPVDADDIVVSNRAGVWRSLDGGLTWAGLNEGLPNLPVRKLLTVPGSRTWARIALDGGMEAAWPAGQRRSSWVVTPAADARSGAAADRALLSNSIGAPVLASASAGDLLYGGGVGGRLWSSADQGRTWRGNAIPEGGAVEAMFVAAEEPRVALAALGAAAGAEGRGPRVVRTFNGGLFWDDLTANLPPGDVHGVAADLASGAVYAASGSGLFVMYLDLRNAGGAGQWQRVDGLPAGAPVWDVRLDEGAHQLFAAVDGHGVFAALAPHRLRNPRVVNAADMSARAAAPGTLLSVLGSNLASARAGSVEVPVLAAAAGESQIQIPFELTGTQLSLALFTAGAARRDVQLPLLPASPAIFVDRDGTPMLLDADRGVLLDPGVAARAGSRIQIIATGLGKVTPNWPTGTPAPAENTPRVVAPVRAFIDRVPVEVTRATLAPGFVGFYLVELTLPETVNNGPAELYIEAAGQSSGRVTIQLAQ